MLATPTASPDRRTCDTSTNAALGRYMDTRGRRREIVCRPGPDGSRLVIARLADRLEDPRLLAHLGADEPSGNAELVCRLYLADPRRPRCRGLRREDFQEPPAADRSSTEPRSTPPADRRE